MRALLLLSSVVGISLCACASTSNPKPAICDGKHTRPANLYGSVLPAEAPRLEPAPTAPLKDGEAKAPPKALSAIDPRSFAPCGRLA